MNFRIHYTLSDGSEDSIIVTGDDIEQIREKADAEVAKRGGTDPWSEEI
jgi:hypothetical protein